jgi:hypothetical protein
MAQIREIILVVDVVWHHSPLVILIIINLLSNSLSLLLFWHKWSISIIHKCLSLKPILHICHRQYTCLAKVEHEFGRLLLLWFGRSNYLFGCVNVFHKLLFLILEVAVLDDDRGIFFHVGDPYGYWQIRIHWGKLSCLFNNLCLRLRERQLLVGILDEWALRSGGSENLLVLN